MRGMSIYIGQQTAEVQLAYLKRMKKAGFTTIFTSLHIPEDDGKGYADLLKELGNQARELGMELFADISPVSFPLLGLSLENAEELISWGVAGIRLDYGIEPLQIVELSQKMKIALNASTLNEDFLEALLKMGLQSNHTEVWHNFYPRPETGLERLSFIEKNKRLQEYGLTVMAFIPGDGELRGPIYESLPTLEEHRRISPFFAYLDIKECYVDKVIIGDKSISPFCLEQFEWWKEGKVGLRCNLYTNDPVQYDIINIYHRSRMDPSRDVIRSETSRLYALPGQKVSKENTVVRQRGCITIDNEKYGRYSGELQILKKDLPADEKVNVAGKIIAEDMPLIDLIAPGSTFHFIPI
ncbi:DUF871 domain-containing protein [Bacillus sp. 1P06AnD]|uniref:DUF871 domain-containing protein n=1 Tax=Bacillus sp. 1P06AnD TaxID=3132208 RepID=UPI0039A06C1C